MNYPRPHQALERNRPVVSTRKPIFAVAVAVLLALPLALFGALMVLGGVIMAIDPSDLEEKDIWSAFLTIGAAAIAASVGSAYWASNLWKGRRHGDKP